MSTPGPDDELLTVVMLPDHFIAYQRWLGEHGLMLFQIPEVEDKTYAVTATDETVESLRVESLQRLRERGR